MNGGFIHPPRSLFEGRGLRLKLHHDLFSLLHHLDTVDEDRSALNGCGYM